MNHSRLPLTKTKSSDSGMRPKVARRGQPTAQVDDEFHAFFDRGDLGDYEGGVAFTQPPASLDPITTEESHVVRTSQQRERRALLAKVVATVVVGCATLMLIAVGYKVRSERDSAVKLAEPDILRTAIGNAATVAPNVQHVPVQPQAIDLEQVAPPPAPPESEQPTTESMENATVASSDPEVVQPSVTEPRPMAAAAEVPIESVKKLPPTATRQSTPDARVKGNTSRVGSREQRSTVGSKQRLKPNTAVKSVPTPAPQAKPSVAAFPVD